MRAIVIGHFRRPDDISNSTTVKACNFPTTKQSILHDPMQLPCDFVFLRPSEGKARGRIRAK
jgi:hypothetical protein